MLTCPTTACFNGLDAENTVDVGGQLRYFGDGYQASKVLDGRRYWRVPVMEGEFLVEERFGVVEGVAGGNIIMLRARRTRRRCARREAAASAMREVEGAIMPFPGGIVAQRQQGRLALHARCRRPPTTRCARRCARQVEHTDVPEDVEAVFEIVIDGARAGAGPRGDAPRAHGRRRRRAPATSPPATTAATSARTTSTCASSIAMTLTLTLREQPAVPLEPTR